MTARETATKVVEETRAEHILQMQGLVEQAEGLFASVEQKRKRIAAAESRSRAGEGRDLGGQDLPLSRAEELDLVRQRLTGGS